MQKRRTLHQTLQQRNYGGFPPGALLKRARGMYEAFDLLNISVRDEDLLVFLIH